MVVTIHIHDSWAAHPGPLARILAQLAALEAPAPWTPTPAREPGDDDLAELLEGIDAPEATPAKPAAVAPKPTAKAFDGPPLNGRSLYRWATFRKILPSVNRLGKQYGFPKMISDWEPDQVARVHCELTAETNGKAH